MAYGPWMRSVAAVLLSVTAACAGGPGISAAGACRRGRTRVAWAFNEGREAARECDHYLMGYTDLP